MSFRFKQFYVNDSRCAMKVGTDGVLLGAWVANNRDESYSHILDIGTGSGLIALMLAQRFEDSKVLGIEIDEQAALQAKENVAESVFAERIEVCNCALQQFQTEEKFDLIVSNPPYFNHSLKNPNDSRRMARHTDSLRYEELISRASELLTENGCFAVVLPKVEQLNFVSVASDNGLFLTRQCDVRGRAELSIKRVLLEFNKNCTNEVILEELILESAINQRSKEYVRLAKDFYL